MKSHLVRLLRSLLPAVALLAVVPLLPAQQPDGTNPDTKAPATNVMLQDLDRQLTRIDEFLENAPTPQEKATAKARVDKLKERRAELNKNYVQAQFESLKADIKAEHDKLALWPKKAS